MLRHAQKEKAWQVSIEPTDSIGERWLLVAQRDWEGKEVSEDRAISKVCRKHSVANGLVRVRGEVRVHPDGFDIR